jgi:hypothetical protein
MERARTFYEDRLNETQSETKSNIMQMCGGCGVIMSQSDIENCEGENCVNFKKGLERTLRV